MAERIYLYALTDTPLHDGDMPVFRNSPLLYIRRTFVPSELFDETPLKEHLANAEWLEKTVRDHEAVVSECLEKGNVVPFKFPTIFLDELRYQAFLEREEKTLRYLFERLKGTAEWGIKVYADLAHLETTISSHPSILALNRDIAASTAGKAFLLTKKKTERQKELVRDTITLSLKSMLDDLRSLCRDFKVNSIHSKEVTQRNEEMALNLSFLIDRSYESLFLSAAERWRNNLAPSGLFLEYSGAWAPYNFCTIEQHS